MRISRFLDEQGLCHYGLDQGDGTALLLTGKRFHWQPTAERVSMVQRLAPVEPVCIYAIGRNYAEHIRETGAQADPYPVVFMKPLSSVCADGDAIPVPASCQHGPELDYEAELAVVIGKTALNVPVEQALDYVYGYCNANDLTARRWQKHAGGNQWIRGKGFDRFCPLGPVLVTADQIADPQQLSIQTRLNGQIMQDSNTSNMLCSVAQLISYLSQDTSLLPGTVILTGTPEGVGFARKPPRYLQPGDEVQIEIQGLGILTNRIE